MKVTGDGTRYVGSPLYEKNENLKQTSCHGVFDANF